MSDFSRTSIVTARKVHHCDWCSISIAKGEMYAHGYARLDNHTSEYRYHTNCLRNINPVQLEQAYADRRKGKAACPSR